MIDDASVVNKVTPVFSRQTYLEWSKTAATMGRRACARLKQPCEDVVLLGYDDVSIKVTDVQFDYTDPEDGGSKLLQNFSNYLPVGLHTS
jgi:hypothetical protein